MNQISVTRLTKSQIITIPMLAETPATSPIDTALEVFRQKMRTALEGWRSGKMSASACASECEQLYEDATEGIAIILQKADNGNSNGNSIGKVPCGSNIPESVGHAFCMTALTLSAKPHSIRCLVRKQITPSPPPFFHSFTKTLEETGSRSSRRQRQYLNCHWMAAHPSCSRKMQPSSRSFSRSADRSLPL